MDKHEEVSQPRTGQAIRDATAAAVAGDNTGVHQAFSQLNAKELRAAAAILTHSTVGLFRNQNLSDADALRALDTIVELLIAEDVERGLGALDDEGQS